MTDRFARFFGQTGNGEVETVEPAQPELLPAEGQPLALLWNLLWRCGGPRPVRLRQETFFSGPGLVALVGRELVGFAKASSLPALRDDERLFWMDAAILQDRAEGPLAGRLLAGTLESLPPGEGRLRVLASTPQGQEGVAAALVERGFREIAAMRRFESAVGHPVSRPDPRFRLRFYGGGEPALDDAIAALYRRAFHAQPSVPALTPQSLGRFLEDSRYSFALLFEAESLVAEASLWEDEGELYVGTILVARSHWASGASDFLMNELLCHAARRGCARFSGQIAASNRANLALVERCIPDARLVLEMRRFERLTEA